MPATSDIVSTAPNSSHTANSTSSLSQLDLAEDIVTGYIQPAICVFGILCNLLNLLILTRPKLKESPYTYLLGLAVTDLGLLVILFVGSFDKRIANRSYSWQVFNAFVFLPIGNVFANSSIWITVLLTIERWISVRFPLKAKKMCTKQLARWAIIGVVVVMLVINTPRFFCREIIGKFENGSMEYLVISSAFEQSDVFSGIVWMYIITIIIIPCLILTVLNSCLLHVVYKANRNRSELNIANENNIAVHISREQRRLTVTCVSIICLFLICVSPAAFAAPPVSLALFGKGRPPEEYFSSPLYRLISIVNNTLLGFNLSLNFVLYCLFNHKFYKTLVHLIRVYMYRICKIDIPDSNNTQHNLSCSDIELKLITGSPNNNYGCARCRNSIKRQNSARCQNSVKHRHNSVRRQTGKYKNSVIYKKIETNGGFASLPPCNKAITSSSSMSHLVNRTARENPLQRDFCPQRSHSLNARNSPKEEFL